MNRGIQMKNRIMTMIISAAVFFLFMVGVNFEVFAEDVISVSYVSNFTNVTAPGKQIKSDGTDLVIASVNSSTASNFLGWSTDPAAAEAEYLPGEIYKSSESITLYGVWEDPYDIGIVDGSSVYEQDIPFSGADVLYCRRQSCAVW